MALALLMMSWVWVSCSEEDTTDTTPFALYYMTLTDIGPSMSGELAAPTYKGSAPSDFTIYKVTLQNKETLKDEIVETESFQINESTGAVTVTNSAELAVGLYKLSVACYSNGKRYEFPNAIEVNMLPPVPEGVTVEPELVTIDFSELAESEATAQVTTDGDHVSITAYAVIQEQGKEYFAISNTGEISVNHSYAGEIPPGKYTISLKLTTGAGDCIFENAVTFNITSKPLSLTYTPAEGKIEEGGTFTSVEPVLKGSLEELVYSISKVTPETDQITIDPATGMLSVADTHTLTAGSQYVIDVTATNMYGTTAFPAAYTLNVVEYIEPIANFAYDAQNDIMQGTAFTASPVDEMTGDDVNYALGDNLDGQLTIDVLTGVITAAKGNKIPMGSYTVPVTATNVKGEATTNFTFTVVENPYYFTTVRYGNNLGLDELANANQFRYTSKAEFTSAKLSPVYTDIKEGVEVEWSVKIKHQMKETTIDAATGELSFADAGWKDAQCGLVMVTATTGKGTPAETSVTVPVFFNFATAVKNVTITYTPFVFQVNPVTGGSSVAPTVQGTDLSTFVIDYRRTFNYYNFNGPASHIDGQPSVAGSFMRQLWEYYYIDLLGKATANTGQKWPLSYYDNNGVDGRNLSMPLGYVDADNNLCVKINPNKFIGDDGVPANGAMVGQMTFVTDGNEGNVSSGSQVFPLFIWFDTAF